MEARLGGGKVNLAANKNKDNDVGGVAKERNEGKEKGGKKRTGVEVRRRREGGRWGRSVKSHGQRQTKEGGEKCTHLPYPADRRKLNQAEVSSGSSEGRKSMRKCSPGTTEESL